MAKGKTTKKTTGARWSKAMADEMIKMVALGYSLRQIAAEPGFLHERKLKEKIAQDQELRERFLEAKRVAALFMADEIVELSDEAMERAKYFDQDGNKRTDSGGVQAVKLQVDSRKWLLVKLLPKVFGEKFEAEITDKTDLEAKLAAARERLLVAGKEGRKND